MTRKQSIDKNYVSEIDKAHATYDKENPKSPAQQAEIDKYKKVYERRDHATTPKQDKDLFDFTE